MSPVIQACCVRVKSETRDVKVFTFRAQDAPAEFLRELQPGRHVAISYPDTSGVSQQRLYSITGKEGADAFEIAVKRSDRRGVSDHMHSTLFEGSVIPLRYVSGDISVETVGGLERLGMIVGGIGITLSIALLRELARRSRNGQCVPDTVLLLCTPRVVDIPFLHELLELSKASAWFTLRIFLTQEKVQASDQFMSGRPSADALRVLGQPQAIVICGSHAFAQAFREHASALFPFAALRIESFSPSAAALAVQELGSAARSCRLHIADTGKIVEAPSGKSLLEMLEGCNVFIRSQCRAGICGNCRVKVSGGESRFESDFCLSEKEKSSGYTLACCTFPLSGDILVSLKPTAQIH